ncbi:unnamed protein product [Notodromas monacha]|uniref:Uncharacterized protein n=1 Tax=Notodromas monacha TaxID=399045 RepID=A0A7R9GAC4_9CRUS|nr:unnamed protein product [Notodromas monacha]CAG0915204.1 unnamed protein product [Notodromas monacha]
MDEQVEKKEEADSKEDQDDELADGNPDEEEAGSGEKVKFPYQILAIYAYTVMHACSGAALSSVSHTYKVTELQMEPGLVTKIQQATGPIFTLLILAWSYVAEAWTGRFPVMIICCVCYIFGHVLVTGSDLAPILWYPDMSIGTRIFFFYAGSTVISFFNTGEATTSTAFGADQFKLPEQETEKNNFFFWDYSVMNAALCLMYIVSPAMRNVSCFGNDDCYSLALGMAGIFAILILIAFAAASPWYVKVPPVGNVTGRAFACIFYAIKNKLTKPKNPEYNHWMQYAEYSGYTPEFIAVVKHLLDVSVMLFPLSFYWALYHMNKTRWIDMGYQMNGTVPYTNFTLKSDELQWYNPLLTFIMVPFSVKFIFPVLNKIKIMHTMVQKLVAGFVIMVITYILITIICYAVEENNPRPMKLTKDTTALQIVGGMAEGEAPVTLFLSGPDFPGQMRIIFPGATASWEELKAGVPYKLSTDISGTPTLATFTGKGKEAFTGLVHGTAGSPSVNIFPDPEEQYGMTRTNRPVMRAIVLTPGIGKTLDFIHSNGAVKSVTLPSAVGPSEYLGKPDVGLYTMKLDGQEVGQQLFESGAVYSVVISGSAGSPKISTAVQAKPAVVNLIWILIPVTVVTVSEMLVSPTAIAFWYNEWQEFLLYTFLITLNTILVILIARWFKSNEEKAGKVPLAGPLGHDNPNRVSMVSGEGSAGRPSVRKSVAALGASKALNEETNRQT